jgi:hypothetical protein
MLKNFYLPLCFLILAWASIAVSFFLEANYGGNWFMRSGSLMVLFSIVAEFLLLDGRDEYLNQRLSERKEPNQQKSLDSFHPSQMHKLFEIISHISVVIGTVIWGYGDLLYSPFN